MSVVDQITGDAWTGRAVRVVNEHPTRTSESMIGFLFDSTGSPPLSVGSIITYQSRRFVVRGAGDIRGATVRGID